VGDTLGMAATHGVVSGMGGMRTAGDLVARMQISRGMRIKEAKEYVADRLRISVQDLGDPVMMSEIREDLNLGMINPYPNLAIGIEAKFRIAESLGIKINCLNRFKEKAGVIEG
jgi:dimethylamine--corrinoid protein Co-methyltransferase